MDHENEPTDDNEEEENKGNLTTSLKNDVYESGLCKRNPQLLNLLGDPDIRWNKSRTFLVLSIGSFFGFSIFGVVHGSTSGLISFCYVLSIFCITSYFFPNCLFIQIIKVAKLFKDQKLVNLVSKRNNTVQWVNTTIDILIAAFAIFVILNIFVYTIPNITSIVIGVVAFILISDFLCRIISTVLKIEESAKLQMELNTATVTEERIQKIGDKEEKELKKTGNEVSETKAKNVCDVKRKTGKRKTHLLKMSENYNLKLNQPCTVSQISSRQTPVLHNNLIRTNQVPHHVKNSSLLAHSDEPKDVIDMQQESNIKEPDVFQVVINTSRATDADKPEAVIGKQQKSKVEEPDVFQEVMNTSRTSDADKPEDVIGKQQKSKVKEPDVFQEVMNTSQTANEDKPEAVKVKERDVFQDVKNASPAVNAGDEAAIDVQLESKVDEQDVFQDKKIAPPTDAAKEQETVTCIHPQPLAERLDVFSKSSNSGGLYLKDDEFQFSCQITSKSLVSLEYCNTHQYDHHGKIKDKKHTFYYDTRVAEDAISKKMKPRRKRKVLFEE